MSRRNGLLVSSKTNSSGKINYSSHCRSTPSGELTHEQMRDEFLKWSWTTGHLDGPDGPDGEWPEMYVRGSWDELLDAVPEGLITHEDYEYAFNRTTT
jgi:hypothetical protein